MPKEKTPPIPSNTRSNASVVSKDKLSNQAVDCILLEGNYLGDTMSLSRTSTHFFNIFKPQLLLLAVAYGKEMLVQKMLKEPMLLLKNARVTDFSSRHFPKITAYQYALWAGDVDIVRIIEKTACKAKGTEGEKLRAALLKQWEELRNKKISYTLEGTKYYEAAYNPAKLVKAYLDYTMKYNRLFNTKGCNDLTKMWSRDVGIQQSLMPVHAIQTLGYRFGYYHNKRIVNICNPQTGKTALDLSAIIVSQNSGLGVSFAIIRAARKHCEVDAYVAGEEAHTDWKTLEKLFNTIKKELEAEPILQKKPDKDFPCIIS